MTTPSQEQRILSLLRDGVELTPLNALRLAGSLRLGARIYDLRRKGYPIEGRMVQLDNGKHVKAYRMGGCV